MALFSLRTARIDSENAFKLGPHIAKVEAGGGRVIRCNLGEPDFLVPEHIRDEVKRQLDLGNTHYTDPQGIASLRAAVAQQMRAKGVPAEPERVVVFPGAKPPIGFSQQIYLDPGDEVIYPSPGFPIYESFTGYVSAKPVPLLLDELRGFSFGAADLEALITPRTKLVILNFPSNPTGGVATAQELTQIAEMLNSRLPADARVYSDEVYEDILFDGRTHTSIASLPGMAARTIVVGGVSKSFAWTGGRIGWALLPTVEEAQVFKNLNINYFSCISGAMQEGARVGLESPRTREAIARMGASFQERRDLMVAGLNAIDGVRCQKPGGAFYVFPNIAGVLHALGAIDAGTRLGVPPSKVFQMFLLYRHGLATMDRNSFGRLGVVDQHFLRFSTATALDDLREGLRRMATAACDKRGFEAFVRESEGGRSW
ncbi:MAG: pyridoxal phosphate-dependent aminotransferase [Polyangiales bacterium]